MVPRLHSFYIYMCVYVCTYIERDNNCSISSSPIRLELLSELNTGRTGSYEVELNITSLVYIFANGYRERRRSKNRASIFAREENKKGGEGETRRRMTTTTTTTRREEEEEEEEKELEERRGERTDGCARVRTRSRSMDQRRERRIK